jgi:tetratricopeptide (TPR) repeat protein
VRAIPSPEAQAEIAFRGGDLASARRILLDSPNRLSPDARHMLAIIEKRSGNLQAARKHFSGALKEKTYDPHLHNNFANLLDDLGEFDLAVRHYKLALNLKPDFADPAINMGLVCQRGGRFAEARAAFETALKIAPGNARAWHGLGAVLFEEGELDAAANALEKAIALEPRNGMLLHLRARIAMESGRYSEPFYLSARAANPDDLDLQLAHAVTLYDEGSQEEGIEALRVLTSAHPGWVKGHAALSRLLWESGNSATFAESFETALAKESGNSSLWTNYLSTLMQAGMYDKTLGAIAGARKAIGEQRWFDQIEALSASECGDIARADHLFERMPADPEIAIAQVRHLLRARRPGEAIDCAQAAIGHADERGLWPYLAIAWRLTGDARWDWYRGNADAVAVLDLGLTTGDLDKLSRRLRSLHTRSTHPFDQSLRGGTQTNGSLLARREPEIVDLAQAFHAAAQTYIRRLPEPDGRHPLLNTRRDAYHLRNSWSSCLKSGGVHLNHVHPAGWISSAFYASLPSSIGENEANPAGWLQFGVPPQSLGLDLEPILLVEPKPGRIVLFPSLMWHGTLPFPTGERLTVAFDVVPSK